MFRDNICYFALECYVANIIPAIQLEANNPLIGQLKMANGLGGGYKW
jgi:hypothetical protein